MFSQVSRHTETFDALVNLPPQILGGTDPSKTDDCQLFVIIPQIHNARVWQSMFRDRNYPDRNYRDDQDYRDDGW